jgi:hypothetical protein
VVLALSLFSWGIGPLPAADRGPEQNASRYFTCSLTTTDMMVLEDAG